VNFSEKYGMKKISLTPEVLSRLLSYNFPGNIRELESIITEWRFFQKTER